MSIDLSRPFQKGRERSIGQSILKPYRMQPSGIKPNPLGLTKPDDGVEGISLLVSGLITGVVSLCLHIFWKFRTANSERAKWKTLFPIAWLPRKKQRHQSSLLFPRYFLRKITFEERAPIVNQRKPIHLKALKQYQRSTA